MLRKSATLVHWGVFWRSFGASQNYVGCVFVVYVVIVSVDVVAGMMVLLLSKSILVVRCVMLL